MQMDKWDTQFILAVQLDHVTRQHRTAKDSTGTADAGLPQMARDNVGGHAVSYLHRVSKKMKVTVTSVISQSSRMVLREKGQQKVQSGRA